ncbi:hypothetical protein [Sinorhizobium sp. GL28]|uniref:hypothetical protein n=1 Tax=Sinorhizobium sp. GL28 TaxID=1358418 RepID=UPI00071C27D3|nr:hypothetical protein [Sinorhizobium sp. GL28]KSV94865.1 hypothetical protein N184_36060 [Sinorhizobium sp. GL28]
MNYGYVIKRNDNDYIVNVDLENVNSGYSVVPKDVDPYNLYEIEDVKLYCTLNPDKVLAQHPKEQEEQKKEEIKRLKQYLFDTDYAVIKCSEQNLDLGTEYPRLKEKRQEARTRINELESTLQ